MSKRVVITGIGVLASNGIGKEAFWKALREGKSGVKPVTLFDTTKLRSKLAGEISAFKPEDILGPKGLRNLDRSTDLTLCASMMALDDAGLKYPLTDDDTDLYGVSLGSTMGSLWSISEFDKEALRVGPRAVNPALFQNTVINSPASHIAIRFNIQGFNATISTGFCSSLDAMYYAMNMIDLHDYKVVLAGGVEELCEQTYKGFYRLGHLAGSREGKEEVDCPFDLRRNGIVFGEGAGMVIMEELGHALKRDAKIYAEILGYGTAFDTLRRNICDPKAKGAAAAMRSCLKDSNVSSDSVDYVCAAADSTPDCDAMETSAVKSVFGDKAKMIPISSIKSMIGECFSASGAMGVVATVGMLEEGFIPATVNYERPDRRCDLDCVPNEARSAKIERALVNAFSPTGSNSSVCISKYTG